MKINFKIVAMTKLCLNGRTIKIDGHWISEKFWKDYVFKINFAESQHFAKQLKLKLRIKMKMIEAFLHVDLLSPICRPVTTERVEIESKREERAQHWIAMNRIAASQLQFHSILLSSTLSITFSPSSRCSEFENYLFETLSFKSF